MDRNGRSVPPQSKMNSTDRMTLSDGRIERSAAQDTIKFPLFLSVCIHFYGPRFYYFVAAARTSIRGVGGGLGDGLPVIRRITI